MSKLLNFGTKSGGGLTLKKEFTSVRVVDIILDPSHPKYKNVDSIGIIFYGDIINKKGIDNSETLPTAKPLFSYQKYLPLINEIANVVNSDYRELMKAMDKRKTHKP